MRYLFALLLLGGCAPAALIPSRPTGVIIAQASNDDLFAACEVSIGEEWSAMLRRCGAPLASYRWLNSPGGACHVYETNTVGLGTGVGAPFVAVCVNKDHHMNTKGKLVGEATNMVLMVVGLKANPVRK